MAGPYDLTPRRKLPTPKRGSRATIVADLQQLATTLDLQTPAPIVQNDVERAILFPTPKQGDTVYHNGRGHSQRWYDLRTQSNPGGAEPAGWHQIDFIDTQRGRVMNVYEIGWSGGGFRWPDRIKLLKEFTVPDQGGYPYRLQVKARGEVFVQGGAPAGSPRYDLQITAGGANGTVDGDVIGADVADGSRIFQRIDTLPTARSWTGPVRVSLRAARLANDNAPDGAWAEATAFNRDFVVVTITA